MWRQMEFLSLKRQFERRIIQYPGFATAPDIGRGHDPVRRSHLHSRSAEWLATLSQANQPLIRRRSNDGTNRMAGQQMRLTLALAAIALARSAAPVSSVSWITDEPCQN
jgi:hypothetical protein